MNLSIRQAYLAMFHLLDVFYWDTRDEDFASLVSGFDPYLFEESMSADPAAWGDWKDSVKKVTDRELLTTDEALDATRKFIVFHRDEFGFNLGWLVDRLDGMTANDKNWLDSIENALI